MYQLLYESTMHGGEGIQPPLQGLVLNFFQMAKLTLLEWLAEVMTALDLTSLESTQQSTNTSTGSKKILKMATALRHRTICMWDHSQMTSHKFELSLTPFPLYHAPMPYAFLCHKRLHPCPSLRDVI